ncbi:MAG: hypothetical protein HY903_20995 [Deltaproteobacteria bacterium]|nr:hypothetical protein [Deltaproteobacteria bacterium]
MGDDKISSKARHNLFETGKRAVDPEVPLNETLDPMQVTVSGSAGTDGSSDKSLRVSNNPAQSFEAEIAATYKESKFDKQGHGRTSAAVTVGRVQGGQEYWNRGLEFVNLKDEKGTTKALYLTGLAGGGDSSFTGNFSGKMGLSLGENGHVLPAVSAQIEAKDGEWIGLGPNAIQGTIRVEAEYLNRLTVSVGATAGPKLGMWEPYVMSAAAVSRGEDQLTGMFGAGLRVASDLPFVLDLHGGKTFDLTGKKAGSTDFYLGLTIPI